MAGRGLRRLGTGTPHVPRLVVGAWLAAVGVGVAYGVFVTVIAVCSPFGAELTGRWFGQPAFKAAMALLLAVAAAAHPVVRERKWLLPALVFSGIGDGLLAIPWWPLSFVFGLGAFLLAHVCYLGVLVPLARSPRQSRGSWVAVVVLCLAATGLLVWFWPQLCRDGMTIPVTGYIAVVTAMACAALRAQLPTWLTAAGAVCFVASDAMIGIGRFVLDNEALAVPIWWVYALAQMLITAGFFFGRIAPESAVSAG
ncbi:MAG: lysoplasmalogenase [Mycobacteriaceae bacterium]|nr:lysoplasmalogenase [Mycobacteriaceae bacterium]